MKLPRPYHYALLLIACAVVLVPVCYLLFFAHQMNELPRNMRLTAFQPHRADFTCVHEATKLPAVTVEAERLFQQGMTVTSYELWPNQRDYKQAAQLWEKAAALGHWKAAMNLAGLYERGLGVERDTEHAVLIVEGLMKQGVPAAFDKMGTYHQSGIGVKPDIDRAYGFWQLAADMGSPGAQTYIGKKLKAAYDSEAMGVWGNRKVGLKMMECAFSQGSGDAAYELGLTVGNTDRDYARALVVLHQGVKFGSKDATEYLLAAFGNVEPLTGNVIDHTRADRYMALAEALELNPDLRFPNLDKVLPLPPAALPFWDGKRETLIDAAKAVLPTVTPPPSAASQRTGRAHMPDGYVLSGHGTTPPDEPAQYQGHKAKGVAHYTGYWRPEIDTVRSDAQQNWNKAQVPLRFTRGEALPDLREVVGPGNYVTWWYQGQAVRQAAPPVHPLVAQGRARQIALPAMAASCSGTAPCPHTGIWFARLKKGHPQYAVFHSRWQQAYVEQGQPFPVPAALHGAGGLAVAARDLRWHWLGEANEVDRSGHVHVTVGVRPALAG